MAMPILITGTWLAPCAANLFFYEIELILLMLSARCIIVLKQSRSRPLKMLVSAVLSDKRPDEVPQVGQPASPVFVFLDGLLIQWDECQLDYLFQPCCCLYAALRVHAE
jgi:hypothetical protein